MGKNTFEATQSHDEIMGRLHVLEERMARLEAELSTSRPAHSRTADVEYEEGFTGPDLSGSAIESKFGEYGLAWLGNLVLLFGIIFLVKYLQNSGFNLVSIGIGYMAVAGLFLVSKYLKSSHPNMASIFSLNGYVLLFIVTLQLHFFTKEPLLPGLYLELVLLLAVTLLQGVIAVRRHSEGLTGLAFVMAAVTAIMSDSTHIALPVALVISIIAVYLMSRAGWWRLLIFSIFLVYFINLVWLLGNPFMGHDLQVIKIHGTGYIYLFFIAATYSLTALLPRKENVPDNGVISAVIINGLGFSMLVTFYVLAFFKDNYIMLFGTIALFCLLYSVWLQSKSAWKLTASLYALYSFVALSVTVYGIYDFPRAYFLLSIQSLLVVSMALWFKSRVIVVMNTFLFVILLIAYLSTSGSMDSINISFALVSLVTARILNWQKDRLQIKTEFLRNTYLFIGFCMVLLALYRILPGNYVTLSWTAAAVLYFILSFVLNNIKYRYLALATMVAAAFYLFIVDLARVGILYRVMAFLFLAVISITLSLYYTRRRKGKTESKEA